MADGQLGNRRQRLGTEPQRLVGPPTLLEGAGEGRLGVVGAQVAVPLAVPAGGAGVQVEVGRHTSSRTSPSWRVQGGQSPASARRVQAASVWGLQVRPDAVVEWAEGADPAGQRQ
jgi:hypothetical protein